MSTWFDARTGTFVSWLTGTATSFTPRRFAYSFARSHAGPLHASPCPEVFSTSHDPNELPPMHLVEERYLQKVLAAVRGNKTLAAKVLGFDRRTLYRKLERLKGGGHDEGEFEADPADATRHASPPPPGE